MTYLRQLIQTTIRAQKRPASMTQGELEVGVFAQATQAGARAASYAGIGLDVLRGECLLAGVHVYEEHRGFGHRLAAAVTNRRTIFGGWSTVKGALNDHRGSVEHDAVMGIEEKRGLVTTKFNVLTPGGPLEFVQLYGHYPDISKFFMGLSQIPMGQRSDPAIPLPGPTQEDPVGAHAAMASLWFPDERAQVLLGTVTRQFEAGALDAATACDLIARVQLAHRAACSGTAGFGHSFLSPLSADDLGQILVRAFGQAIGYSNPQPGAHCLDLGIDPRRDTLSPALQALGVASYLGLGLGFSPGRMIAAEMMKKQAVNAIRVVYYDVQGGCAYELYANGRKLEQGEAEMAHGIHLLLLHSAWPVLKRRCEVGWQTPYAQLFS